MGRVARISNPGPWLSAGGGVVLLLEPWFFHYSGDDTALALHLGMGTVILLLGVLAARTHRLVAWLNVAAGALTVVLSGTTGLVPSAGVAGVSAGSAVVLVALGHATGRMPA